MSEDTPVRYRKLEDDVQILHFLHDPEGILDSARFGHGYYFQLRGDGKWSGPWPSHEQAVSQAKLALEFEESLAIREEMGAAGFRGFIRSENAVYEREIDGTTCEVVITGGSVTATVGGEVVYTIDTRAEGYGHTHAASRHARQAIQDALELRSAPRP